MKSGLFATMNCFRTTEHGSFDLDGKFVVWERGSGGRYHLLCADQDGFAHAAIADSIAKGRQKLVALSEAGVAATSEHDAFLSLACFNIVAWEDHEGERPVVNDEVARIQGMIGLERIALVSHFINKNGRVNAIDIFKPKLSILRAATSAILDYPVLERAIRSSLMKMKIPDDVEGAADLVHRLLEAEGVAGDRLSFIEKRLRGVECAHQISIDCLGILGRLPRDWIPRATDREEWTQLIALLPTLGVAVEATEIPVEEICKHAGGHWARFADRIFAATGSKEFTATFNAAKDIGDMMRRFEDELGYAILARTGGVDVDDRPRVGEVARQALLEGRGLVAILEMSRKWHERGLNGQNPEALSWDPALPSWTDPASGLMLVPLSNSGELTEEGGKGKDHKGIMGLGHCVAGYWRGCREGRSRIVSVRRRSEDGMFERVSTVDVRLDGGSVLRVSQHRGFGNHNPPDEAAEAVSRYMAELESGRLPIDRDGIGAAWRRSNRFTVEDICGYDWRDDTQMQRIIDAWSPYLKRRLRGLGQDDLVTALGYPMWPTVKAMQA